MVDGPGTAAEKRTRHGCGGPGILQSVSLYLGWAASKSHSLRANARFHHTQLWGESMSEDVSQDQLTRSYAEVADLDARAANVLTRSESLTTEAVGPDALCQAWRGIRPIVEGLSNFPLIPANIRRVLKLLITLVDGVCA